MFTYLVQNVIILYQNVGEKSIGNQDLIPPQASMGESNSAPPYPLLATPTPGAALQALLLGRIQDFKKKGVVVSKVEEGVEGGPARLHVGSLGERLSSPYGV